VRRSIHAASTALAFLPSPAAADRRLALQLAMSQLHGEWLIDSVAAGAATAS
jgi:hypothetical protein